MKNLKFRWHDGNKYIYSVNDKGKSILGWFFCQVNDYKDVEQLCFVRNEIEVYDNDIVNIETYDGDMYHHVIVRVIEHEIALMCDIAFIDIDDICSVAIVGNRFND